MNARVRRFAADVQVTDQYLRLGSDVETYVRRSLDEALVDDMRGPRGGRYVLFGDTEYLGRAHDIMHNLWTFRAVRMGRYARPVR